MSAEPGGASAFDRLHPRVREVIWKMGWPSLRPIQVDAIHEILDKTGDLIVSAKTASGKTEAAFLPIISRIVAAPASGVRAVYAGPLKALINDQFLRIERLCEFAEIPVHKWHGDVGAGAKKALLERPSGILLITPESLEAIFVNHPDRLGALFRDLGFFVIDELHSFLDSVRGAHLLSLLSRIEAKAPNGVRRIGLSATLGDPDLARERLRPSDRERVKLITAREEKDVKLAIKGYLTAASMKDPSRKKAKSENEDEAEEAPPGNPAMMSDLFSLHRGKSALIFGNRKKDIEEGADFARRECERMGIPNTFRVHHGSLSKGEREETEEALRSTTRTATFCSSTLEMGIDVGDLEVVGQIGPPFSVGSMAQRLGRSGRRDGASSIMRIFIEEDEPEPGSPLLNRLYPRLVQAVALVELMVKHWCEPPEIGRLHLSTLVQQILSCIVETGGIQADTLFTRLIGQGAFSVVDRGTFVKVLRSLGGFDLIEQTPQGLLILGMEGEKIARSHDFYTVFTVEKDYRVLHRGRHIGNVTADTSTQAGEHIILAGRRWVIGEVKHDRRTIDVEASRGGRTPPFRSHSDRQVHPRVRAEMRSILLGDSALPYLDAAAARMLADARASAQEAGLADAVFVDEGSTITWFTWTGSRAQTALYGLGKFVADLKVSEEGIALVFEKVKEHEIREAYRRFLDQCPTPEELAALFEAKIPEKYDPYLSQDLLNFAFAREKLDLPGALELIRSM